MYARVACSSLLWIEFSCEPESCVSAASVWAFPVWQYQLILCTLLLNWWPLEPFCSCQNGCAYTPERILFMQVAQFIITYLYHYLWGVLTFLPGPGDGTVLRAFSSLHRVWKERTREPSACSLITLPSSRQLSGERICPLCSLPHGGLYSGR